MVIVHNYRPWRPDPQDWYDWEGDTPPVATYEEKQSLYNHIFGDVRASKMEFPTDTQPPHCYPWTPEQEVAQLYPVDTTLADGRQCLLIDPGSVGNLAGDVWVKEVARQSLAAGGNPTYAKRERELSVSGVGHGAQISTMHASLPIAIRAEEETVGSGAMIHHGHLTIPALEHSHTPGLLGLKSLTENRALLDTRTNRLHFVGPGDFKVENFLPPGSKSFQCEYARSGHMVLPCCEYNGRVDTSKLTLYATEPADERGSQAAEACRGRANMRSQSADNHQKRSSSQASNDSRATAPPVLTTAQVNVPRNY